MGKETISRKTIAKSVVSGVVALASLGALQVGEYKLPQETTEAETEAAGTESGSAAENTGSETVSYSNGFTPGTYTASAKGMESDVTAVCTFDETSLTAVELDVSGETQGIGAAAGEDLTSAFLAAQSPEIDGVSGASVTSTAAKTAVSDCFAQASVDSASEDGEADSADETAAAETDAAEEVNANATDSAGSYTPGTYTASAKGLESDVTAVCTFDETGLTAISLDVSGETPDIGGAIGEEMTAAILNAQSAEVDGVSGATVTSTAVKDAVSECFALAAGGSNAEAASSEETEETTEAAAEGETESAAENETEAAAESETETADDNSAAEEEATEAAAESETEVAEETETEAVAEGETEAVAEGETEAAAEGETEAAAAGAYTPGTYTASAAGISSNVTVTITIEDSEITDMTVDVSGETTGIGADIGDTMIEQVLAAQSAEVDGVSGATVTSTAVKTAVSECLAQAAGGSDAEVTDTEETEETTDAAAEEETDTAEAAATGSYTPGTYTATASSSVGDVTAFCTFNETGLTAIGLDVPGGIADTLSRSILHAQSAEVDSVSGAPEASAAVMEAVQSCFDQAAEN